MKKQNIKQNIKDNAIVAFYWGLIIFLILAILGYVAFNIWLWVTYGNKTVDEIPAWALMFMFWLKR